MSCRDCTGCGQGGNLSESDALAVPADNVSSDGKFPASGNLNSAEPRESTAYITDSHSNAVQPHARVGTVYYDEETGEYVMPGDFFGEGELRWKADTPFPKRETAPQGETAADSSQGSLDYSKGSLDYSTAEDYSTLDGQLRLYDERFDRALACLLRDLQSGAYRRHLRQLGRERLIAGHAMYGDEMYRWHPAVRQANTDEEVADALVYLTSEP